MRLRVALDAPTAQSSDTLMGLPASRSAWITFADALPLDAILQFYPAIIENWQYVVSYNNRRRQARMMSGHVAMVAERQHIV